MGVGVYSSDGDYTQIKESINHLGTRILRQEELEKLNLSKEDLINLVLDLMAEKDNL